MMTYLKIIKSVGTKLAYSLTRARFEDKVYLFLLASSSFLFSCLFYYRYFVLVYLSEHFVLDYAYFSSFGLLHYILVPERGEHRICRTTSSEVDAIAGGVAETLPPVILARASQIHGSNNRNV